MLASGGKTHSGGMILLQGLVELQSLSAEVYVASPRKNVIALRGGVSP